jgi:hypothetical protein
MVDMVDDLSSEGSQTETSFVSDKLRFWQVALKMTMVEGELAKVKVAQAVQLLVDKLPLDKDEVKTPAVP